MRSMIRGVHSTARDSIMKWWIHRVQTFDEFASRCVAVHEATSQRPRGWKPRKKMAGCSVAVGVGNATVRVGHMPRSRAPCSWRP